MKSRHLNLIVLHVIAIGLSALQSQSLAAGLQHPIKAGHPKVLLTPQRLIELKDQLPQNVAFPDAGSLTLKLTPRRKGVNAGLANQPVFDVWDDKRNHILLRHLDSQDTLTTAGFQLAFQGDSRQHPQFLASYLSARQLDLAFDVVHTIRVDWDVNNKTISYSHNGGSAEPMSWLRDSSNQPVPWQPDGQRFEFDARAKEELSDIVLKNEATSQVLAEHSLLNPVMLSGWKRVRSYADGLVTKLVTNCTVPANPLTCDYPAKLEDPSNPDLVTHPNEVQYNAQTLALAWLLTGDTKYKTAAQNFASQILNVGAIAGNDWGMRGRLSAMAILYDWLYAEMSTTVAPGQVSGSMTYSELLALRIRQTLSTADGPSGGNAFSRQICGYQTVIASPLKCNVPPVITGWNRTGGQPSIAPYYLTGHHRGSVAAAAMALAAIGAEQPDVEDLLGTMYDHFKLGFEPAWNWIGAAGGSQVGWAYSTPLFDFHEVWWTALDWGPAGPPAPNGYETQRAMYYLYGLRDDGKTPASFPAVGDNFSFGVDDAGMAQSALYGAYYGNPDTAPYAQWLYDEYSAVKRGGGDLQELLRWKIPAPGRTAQIPDALLPLSRHFTVSGNVVMRDTWDMANVVLAEFHAASYTSQNHQHFDQNSFSLFYKTPLLLDSGVYDYYGSPHWYNYYTRSIAHNTVVVPDAGETFSADGAIRANDGGQWLFDNKQAYPTLEEAQGVNQLGGILRYEHGSDFTYAMGDASTAYSSAKIDPAGGFLRQFLFLRQPSFWDKPVMVVYDQVKVKPGKESLPKVALLHAAVEPVPDGESPIGPGNALVAPDSEGKAPTLVISNGAGMALVQYLLPAGEGNWEMRKLGGHSSGADLRFAAPVSNTMTLANFAPSSLSTGQPMTETELAAVPDAGAWRIEMKDLQGTKEARFLSVISVADSSAGALAPPEATLLIAGEATEAVLFGDALVAVFPKSGVQASRHSFQLPPGMNPRLLVMGLQPATSYGVSVSHGMRTTQVALDVSAGDVFFTSSANGVLELPALPTP